MADAVDAGPSDTNADAEDDDLFTVHASALGADVGASAEASQEASKSNGAGALPDPGEISI